MPLLQGSEINVLDHCSLSQDISAAHRYKCNDKVLAAARYFSFYHESTDNQLSAVMFSDSQRCRTMSSWWKPSCLWLSLAFWFRSDVNKPVVSQVTDFKSLLTEVLCGLRLLRMHKVLGGLSINDIVK